MGVRDGRGKRQYMIRVDRVKRAMLSTIAERLRASGVVLDESYGFIPLDSTSETFLTRGIIDPENVKRIESDTHIHLYPDVGVGPMA
jgi:hypothetical protein